MSRDFTFSKKEIAILAVCLTIVGILVFALGLLTGVRVRLPEESTLQKVSRGEEVSTLRVPEEQVADVSKEKAQPSSGELESKVTEKVPSTRPEKADQKGASPQLVRQPIAVGKTAEMEKPEAGVKDRTEKRAEPSTSVPGKTAPKAKESAKTLEERGLVAKLPSEPGKPKLEAVPPASEQGKIPSFSVQVGAYLVKQNAEDKIKGLKQRGYEASLFESVDSRDRTWYRVLIGSYQTHEEASRMASDFQKKENMPAVVYVKGSPGKSGAGKRSLANDKPETSSQRPKRAKSLLYTIQLGVYLEKQNAEDKIEELKQKGYEASCSEGVDSENRPLYRVLMGSYETREEAARAAFRFKKEENMPVLVKHMDSI